MNMQAPDRPPRILVVGLKQETSVFNPTTMSLEDFEVLQGPTVGNQLRGTETECGGIVAAAEESGLDVTFGTVAWAPSGGPVEENAWTHLAFSILRDVKAAPWDGVIAVLHGSMVVQGNEDPEGWLLSRIRRHIGRAPLCATLDLHAVLSEDMARSADALIPYHTYPHTDYASTGRRCVSVISRALNSGIAPVTAVVRVPLLVRGDELLTATGEYGRLIAQCIDLENRSDVLAAGILIGNPFTDVPDLASNVIVTTDGNPELAVEAASGLAKDFWSNRHLFVAHLTPVEHLPDLVRGDRVTVVSDQADATSSGSTGDSVSVLASLLITGKTIPMVVPLVDAPAVVRAAEIGVGNEGDFTLGASIDTRNSSITIRATVHRLVPGSRITYEDGTVGNCGDVAVLHCGLIEILVTSRTAWFVGRKIFSEHGINLDDKNVIVVKSPNGFRTHYGWMAEQILVADGEGCTTANLVRLPYARVRRPIAPLDVIDEPGLSPRLFGVTT